LAELALSAGRLAAFAGFLAGLLLGFAFPPLPPAGRLALPPLADFFSLMKICEQCDRNYGVKTKHSSLKT
jgi:hypothetical protein